MARKMDPDQSVGRRIDSKSQTRRNSGPSSDRADSFVWVLLDVFLYPRIIDLSLSHDLPVIESPLSLTEKHSLTDVKGEARRTGAFEASRRSPTPHRQGQRAIILFFLSSLFGSPIPPRTALYDCQ